MLGSVHHLEGVVMRVTGVGDAIISRRVSVLEDQGFQDVVSEIRDADAAYVNFEMVVPQLPAIPEVIPKAIRLAAPEWVLDELVGLGFSAFGLANNHAYDFTASGLQETIEVFERRGLPFSGAGRNLEAARMPCYVDTPAGRLAVLNAGSTAALSSLAADPGVLTASRTGINPLRFTTTYQLDRDAFAALRSVDERLGTAASTKALYDTGVFPGARLDDLENEMLFMARRFVRADESKVLTSPLQGDLDGIARWIQEARRTADVVAVGLHCHEGADDGFNLDPPAQFIEVASRACIDAGADVVFGHGPHRIRGVEIYEGRPIFYSLGNFMFMDETLHVFDPGQYETFGLDPLSTPADLHDYREYDEQGRRRGFHADTAFWEGVVARCTFDQSGCTAVELVPIELGLDRLRTQRGVPHRATGRRGADVLARVQELSAGYQTTIDVEDGERPVARVRLS
jgi:poly-gamma-glutamate capsule biosynthesis protein CapA/YwtB (metallophosphatase superfamily)